ncbi:AI-2E family transporter [Pararhizobium mangrovi]|nr:AI-2E family transporter [Pararhizobium mangrovi]
MAENQHEHGGASARIARQTAIVVAVTMAFVIAALTLWYASTAFLTLGVGIVLAVVLDAGTRGLSHLVSWSRASRLALVIFLATAVVAGAITWGGSTLVGQFNEFASSVRQLAQQGMTTLQHSRFFGSGDTMKSLLPGIQTVLGGATTVLPAALNWFSILFAIVFIGPFLAWEPSAYKTIVLSLVVPSRRERVDEVLDGAGAAMRRWLLGQSVSMLVIFVLSIILLMAIGMPYATLLSLQAGLLTFIPTLGPFIAGCIIVLAGFSQSASMALWGLVVYLLIQFVESNLVTPIVQENTIKMPPAATLTLQLAAGFLFGLLGVAFVVPLSAAIQHLIEELYVTDCLGGPWQDKHDSRPSRLAVGTRYLMRRVKHSFSRS